MRFHDTQGVPARTLQVSDLGLRAEIYRSKTSGPGRKVPILPVHVSADAWLLKKEWLVVGWKLWHTMGRTSGMESRDFMLPCPDKNQSGFARRMATYSQATSMSQALFVELKAEENGRSFPLLVQGAGLVWTEHSERATMRTWAQAARVPEDIRRQMGRWLPSPDEGYERSVGGNVRRAEAIIAGFIKENRGRTDPFDEAAVMAMITERMDSMGYSTEEQDGQVDRLLTFGFVTERQEPCKTPVWSAGAGPAKSDGDGEPAEEESVELDEDGFDELEDMPEIVKASEERGRYVVCISTRARQRTLHKLGECHRVPGLHYQEYELLNYELPKAETYHRACKHCFPRGMAEQAGSDEGLSSGEASSSERLRSPAEDDW